MIGSGFPMKYISSSSCSAPLALSCICWSFWIVFLLWFKWIRFVPPLLFHMQEVEHAWIYAISVLHMAAQTSANSMSWLILSWEQCIFRVELPLSLQTPTQSCGWYGFIKSSSFSTITCGLQLFWSNGFRIRSLTWHKWHPPKSHGARDIGHKECPMHPPVSLHVGSHMTLLHLTQCTSLLKLQETSTCFILT